MAENYQITVTLTGRDNLSDDLRTANQNLNSFSQNARGASSASNQASSGMSALGGAVRTVAGVLGTMQLAQRTMELADLGREVTAVRTTFNQLAGGPEAAARSLDNMRQVTGGVVDDMTLMRGANSLLLTGLASTTDQASELVNLGYRLSAAMGVDAKEGIENLNAALLNNSYARLDTLGISAAAVRERVNELKESGMDMSEAFSTAVLEQGTEKLELLGDAAKTGETSVGRLTTQFKNLTQEVGVFMASGVEAGAQLLELGSLALDNALSPDANAGIVSQVTNTRNERLGSMGGNQLRAMDAVDTGALVNFAQQDPQLFSRISSGSAFSNRQFGSEEATTASTGLNFAGMDAIAQQLTGINFDNLNMDEAVAVATELDVQLSAIAEVLGQVAAEEARAAESQAQLNAALDLASEKSAEYSALEAQRAANIAAANRAASEEQELYESLNSSYESLLGVATEFVDVGGIQIMSPDEAAIAVNTAEAMEDRFETLQQLAEDTEFQYISEDELAWAEEMTNQATALADEAQRAADAFEKMSLSQLFGQSGGGRLGELQDMVLGGLNEEQRGAVQRQFDMASGRETEVSTAFEDQIVPMLTQLTAMFGAQAGVDATGRALGAVEEGTLQGMSPEEIIALVTAQIAMTQTATVAGQDAMAMVNGDMAMGFAGFAAPALGGAQGGMPGAPGMAQGMDMMNMVGGNTPLGEGGGATGEGGGGGIAGMQEQVIVLEEAVLQAQGSVDALAATNLDGVLDPFVHSFGTVEEAATNIKTKLDEMAGAEFRTTLVIDVVVNDPTGLALGSNAGFASAVNVAGANAGGPQ